MVSVMERNSTIRIEIDDLGGAAIRALLEEHLRNMYEVSPPDSVHALDLDALQRPDITFWSAWEDDHLVGCGALKELDPRHGEVKSMRTAASHRQRGVGTMMLAHMIAVARSRSYERLSLETGSMEAFRPARTMYEKTGFSYCEPFGDYVADSNSVFMTMCL